MPFSQEMMFVLVLITLFGMFGLAFPIVRRLGNVLEEWVRMRQESLPEREFLERIDASIHTFGSRLSSLEQRMDLAAERQDFVESLMDQRQLRPSDTEAP